MTFLFISDRSEIMQEAVRQTLLRAAAACGAAPHILYRSFVPTEHTGDQRWDFDDIDLLALDLRTPPLDQCALALQRLTAFTHSFVRAGRVVLVTCDDTSESRAFGTALQKQATSIYLMDRIMFGGSNADQIIEQILRDSPVRIAAERDRQKRMADLQASGKLAVLRPSCCKQPSTPITNTVLYFDAPHR